MAVQLAPNALVDVATVLGELGLGSDPTGSPITRLTNVASARIESYLQRSLVFAQRTEQYGVAGGPRPGRIQVKAHPIYPPAQASVLGVTLDLDPGSYDGSTVTLTPGEDWWLEDATRGWIFRQSRWPSTALRRPDIVQDWDPDNVELTTQISYLAGFLTDVQIGAAGAWPGAAKTVAAGLLISPAAQPDQVWCCTVAGTTGAAEPSWPASPSAQFATQADGSTVVWSFFGWSSSVATAPQARTLPWEIEQAAIDAVVSWYRRRGQALEATAEKFGDASQTYGTRLALPTTALELLAPFREIAIG